MTYPDVIFGHSVQINGSNIHIGKSSCIGEFCWLSSGLPESSIIIGEFVLVGRRSLISTCTKLEIGSFCVLAPNVYIGNTDHIFDDPFQPIIQQGATRGSPIVIEENCWFGWNCAIMANVGRGSIIGVNSVVTTDIPPLCVAVGNPAKIKKMWNPELKCWDIDNNRAIEARTKIHIPTRIEYQEILKRNNKLNSIWPEAAGCSA